MTTVKRITLAGGCFWGLEELLRQIPGVVHTQVGYAGGSLEHPTYEDICTGQTGHAESVQVSYDSNTLSEEELFFEFFKIHDPTTLNRQGNDQGSQYRSAIFYQDEQQREAAIRVMHQVEASKAWKSPLVTELHALTQFWRAEEYHQQYLQKNPGGYTCHFVRKLDFKLKS